MSDIESALREYIKAGGTQRSINDMIRDILSEQPKIKIVIDAGFGSFLLTDFALESLRMKWNEADDLPRTNDCLIKLVEKYGSEKIFEYPSGIEIAEVPLGSDWTIENDLNGSESVTW